MTIDEANTALASAAENDIERLLPNAPDWTCYGCRQTWAGGTAPAALICPDCGEPLTEEST